MIDTLFHMVLVLTMPPLLLGVIGKTKAAFAGRVGAPFLQPYYDLSRLMRKGVVISDTTTWIFRAGPAVTLAATLFAEGFEMIDAQLPTPHLESLGAVSMVREEFLGRLRRAGGAEGGAAPAEFPAAPSPRW